MADFLSKIFAESPDDHQQPYLEDLTKKSIQEELDAIDSGTPMDSLTPPMPQISNQQPQMSQSVDQPIQPDLSGDSKLQRYQMLIDQLNQNRIQSPEDLRDLQKQRENELRNLDVMRSADLIVGGMARQMGGKGPDRTEYYRSQEQLANLPVEQFKELEKIKQQNVSDILNQAKTEKELSNLMFDSEMDDPQSDISKFYRQQADAVLKKINPDKTYELENMSAKQLVKALGPAAFQGSKRTPQQTQYVTKQGDPVIFDPQNGKFINGLTGSTIEKPGDVYRNVLYQDAFKNRQLMGPQGNITISSSTRPQIDQANANRMADTFKPDEPQRQALDKEKKRLDGLTTKINEKISSVNRILGALDGDSKLALSMIRTQMPRLAGEVGNLSETEQKVWTGSQAALDRLNQYIKTNVSSQLTDTNKQEMRQIMVPFLKDAVISKNAIIDSSANSLNMIHNIPQDFTKKVYGDLRPLGKISEKLISEQVKIQTPNGTIMMIPKEQLNKALKMGAKQIKD